MFALLVACKREEPNQPEAQYISFSQMSIENLMTAGFDNTITTANLADFDVWGHNGAGVVFGGTKVEKQGDLWVCAEEKLWKPDQTYHFHAFAPSGAVDNVGEYPNAERERGLGNFAYTNAGDKDLIYAYATRTQGSLLKINADPVQLAFEHLLSRVEFTFKNNLSEGNITISNVQITEAAKSAEFNCGDVDMANWVWNATSTSSYSFGGTTAIAKGASASAENVQFLFPATTRNYDISFSIAYESDAAEERTATISDVNLVMGKSYNINVTIEDKDIVTEEYKIEFFVAEVKDWGSNIELDATINGKEEEVPDYNGHEYVDLGLSVKWATCNIGANSPEESGDYFAWGEVEPKDIYKWSTYKYCFNETENSAMTHNLTKYCVDKFGYNGFMDNKWKLDLEDDAAHVNWGGSWRIPSVEDFRELINNCTWELLMQNGVEGYLVTSNLEGYTDNSIFLPFAGCINHEGSYEVGVRGFYWSNSLNSNIADSYDAVYLSAHLSSISMIGNGSRFVGLQIRAVSF